MTYPEPVKTPLSKRQIPATEKECPLRAKIVDEIIARLNLESSSAAERAAVNRQVPGSIPGSPANMARHD